MKILMVVSHLRKGGPIEVVYNLCTELLKSIDFQISILTLRKEGNNSKIEDFKKMGMPVIQLEKSYVECEFRTSRITKEIQMLVDDMHIDIIHCHGYHPVLVCSKILRAKLFSTLHNRANEDFVNAYGFVIGKFMLMRYYKALSLFTENIAVSNSAAKMYQEKIPNVRCVNNGIFVDKYTKASEEEKIMIRKAYDLPENHKIFISTGRIEKEKRYKELVTWFVENVNDNPATLLILGEGAELEDCRKISKNCSNVIYTGRVSNVADYLRAADFYISYSKSEGMSMAVCEGICTGLFPILSDIPSHRDVGECIGALFFDTLESLDINQLIKIQSKKDEFHQYILNYFSIETMSRGYIELYHNQI